MNALHIKIAHVYRKTGCERFGKTKIISAKILLYMFAIVCAVSAVEQSEIESEIEHVNKELKQIQTDRQRNRDNMDADRKEATTYKTRTEKRFTDIKAEIESLKNDITVSNSKRDSLNALILLSQNQRRQIELNEDHLRSALVKACEKCIEVTGKIPPLAAQQIRASTSLLQNELQNKSVEPIEAMNRLVQIYGRIDESSASIQVSQEKSPTPELTGTVYRLRLGSIFEAAVDMKGEKAVVWKGFDQSGNATWVSLGSSSEAAMILKSAGIREGKALPAFADIPFSTDSIIGEKK